MSRDGAWTGRQAALLALLAAINMLSFVDRQLPYILVEPIKQAFGLSDFRYGLLTGPAFALVYVIAALPLARLSDRGHARSVLVGCVAFWSVMTGAGALAASFAQLFASRLGVSLGEAGGTPAALALIAEQVPERRRATAVALFSLGTPVGIMMGLALGGWLGVSIGWRATFLTMVGPGVLLTLIATAILPAGLNHAPGEGTTGPAWGFALAALWHDPGFVWLAVAVACFGIGGYAIVGFAPLLLIRSFHLPMATAGLWLGLANGAGGMVGVFAGGWLVDRLGACDPAWRVRVPMAGVLLSAPISLLAIFAPTPGLAILLFGLLAGTTLLYQAPSFALGLALVDPSLRASASATLLVMTSLVGGVIGPMLVGALADQLAPTWGEGALRIALLVVPAAMICSAVAYGRCGAVFRRRDRAVA